MLASLRMPLHLPLLPPRPQRQSQVLPNVRGRNRHLARRTTRPREKLHSPEGPLTVSGVIDRLALQQHLQHNPFLESVQHLRAKMFT